MMRKTDAVVKFEIDLKKKTLNFNESYNLVLSANLKTKNYQKTRKQFAFVQVSR